MPKRDKYKEVKKKGGKRVVNKLTIKTTKKGGDVKSRHVMKNVEGLDKREVSVYKRKPGKPTKIIKRGTGKRKTK